MVYVKQWSEFRAQALALYAAAPDRARFALKARPSTETLEVKVTDNHKTVKFRAKSTVILNRLDDFQRALFGDMAGAPAPAAAPAANAAGDGAEPKASAGKGGEAPTAKPGAGATAPAAHAGKGGAAKAGKGKKKGKKK
ncbi:hypothetical protein MSPP1_002603 [Malassezia sp. CBS 17886]|nr:hypothetical protein MSPP1_002603 [Malassezia sp. CBS 17886]